MADVIQGSAGITATAARKAVGDLIEAIVNEMKTAGKFTLPRFGAFKVSRTKARKAMNPKNLAPVKVKAGKKVGFKPSPVLRKAM